jgi:hypothetical protein
MPVREMQGTGLSHFNDALAALESGADFWKSRQEC